MKENNFLVFGNDEKMIACRKRLTEYGYEAVNFEGGDAENEIKKYRNIILPLPTLANGCVSGAGITFEKFCSYLDLSHTVFSGNVGADAFPCKAYSYYENEGFLVKNSRLTAQGTLRLILENTRTDIHGASSAVIGYGHCGREICRILKNCGAQVTSFSRSFSAAVRAENEGMYTDNIDGANIRLHEFDIIVNTVPFNIIKTDSLERLTRENMYIETASKPYGFNIADTDKYNFRYILAESLPGRFTPVSAGINIADTVVSIKE